MKSSSLEDAPDHLKPETNQLECLCCTNVNEAICTRCEACNELLVRTGCETSAFSSKSSNANIGCLMGVPSSFGVGLNANVQEEKKGVHER